MLELLELAGGLLELLFAWRFWLCIMVAGAFAVAIFSSSGGSTTGSLLSVVVVIVGVVIGWIWDKSATGSKVP